MHRSWDTNYSIANGGKWAFSDSTDHSKYVVPLEQGFWDWLLSKSKAWGLATYEQDWLYNEFNNVVSIKARMGTSTLRSLPLALNAQRGTRTVLWWC